MISPLISPSELLVFIKESNTIEGIYLDAKGQYNTYEKFLAQPKIMIPDLQEFVNDIQPDAELRDKPLLNVRVGNYVAPYGGPEIARDLFILLEQVNDNIGTPFNNHCQYETLHPFTDGNGRSGRALWLWQSLKFGSYGPVDGSFLHAWYYESLTNFRER